MKKYILSLVLTLVFSLLAVKTSYADGNCQPIYGGGQTCITSTNIAINKTVQCPSLQKDTRCLQNGQFVNNLSINDPRFVANQDVTFQIVVTNTGSTNLDKVVVKDIFPQFINFVSGPGNFDQNSKTLTFELNNLAAGESRPSTIVGRVSTDKELVIGNGVSCVVNQATAQIVSNGQMSQDNSQLCIQKGAAPTTKGGLPVLPAPTMTTTPPTGPEMAVLPLLSGSGILGYFLRRKSKSN